MARKRILPEKLFSVNTGVPGVMCAKEQGAQMYRAKVQFKQQGFQAGSACCNLVAVVTS